MHCQLIVDSFHMSCRGECNEIMINCSLTRKIVWPTSTRSEALKSRIHMSTTKVLAIIYILYLLLSGSLIHDRPYMCTCSYDARNCPLTDCKCINQSFGLSWSICLITTQKLCPQHGAELMSACLQSGQGPGVLVSSSTVPTHGELLTAADRGDTGPPPPPLS